MEFSAVNVPANPEALVVLRSQKFKVSKDWADWKKEAKPLVDPEEEDEDDAEEAQDKRDGWTESFEGVVNHSLELYKEGKYSQKKMDKIYKEFGKFAPKKEHFELALVKVAKGKLVKKVKVVFDKKALLKQLIATAGKIVNE